MAPLPHLQLEDAVRRAVGARALTITGSDDDYVQESEFLAAVKRAILPRTVGDSTLAWVPDNTRLESSARGGVYTNWVIGVRLQSAFVAPAAGTRAGFR